MNDREKVIKGLECHAEVNCVECPYRDGWRTCPFGETLLADALSLLKEQEAVKPTINEDGEAYCVCGENVGFIPSSKDLPKVRSKYCPECGRRMKWE